MTTMQDIPFQFIFFAVASFSGLIFFAVMYFLSRKDLQQNIAETNEQLIYDELHEIDRRLSTLENSKIG